jgi:hypothetical protein
MVTPLKQSKRPATGFWTNPVGNPRVAQLLLEAYRGWAVLLEGIFGFRELFGTRDHDVDRPLTDRSRLQPQKSQCRPSAVGLYGHAPGGIHQVWGDGVSGCAGCGLQACHCAGEHTVHSGDEATLDGIVGPAIGRICISRDGVRVVGVTVSEPITRAGWANMCPFTAWLALIP